jgi:RND family efflux transporter MFP subunit
MRRLVVLPRVVRTLVGLGAIAGSIALAAALVAGRPEPPTHVAIDATPVVRVMTAVSIPVTREWEGHGTARAMASANVSAEVAGTVWLRPAAIEPGAQVGRGDLIVALDESDLAQRVEWTRRRIAALAADLASLDVEERRLREQRDLLADEVDLRERDYQRASQALEAGAGNAIDVERRLSDLIRARRDASAVAERLEQVPMRRARLEAESEAERANLAIAERDLDRTRIIAPFAGRLQAVDVREGERVGVGQRVARVVDLARIEVPLRVSVSAGAFLAPGGAVDLRADSPSVARWSGRVARVSPEADERSRSVTAYVEIEQDPSGPGPLLLPGQFVLGRVRAGDLVGRILVPRRAVDGGRVLVAIEPAEGGPARARSVAVEVLHHIEGSHPDLDPDETQWAVIESGIEPGDRVILSNFDELRDGSPVRLDGGSEMGPPDPRGDGT